MPRFFVRREKRWHSVLSLLSIDDNLRVQSLSMNEDRAIKNPIQEYRLYVGRLLFTLLVVLIMAGVLLWRYYHLQVLEHEGLVTYRL